MQRPAAFGKNQVGRVVNFVATKDIVVATIPSALQVVRFSDLGGAGMCGFHEQPDVKNIEWVPGSHSAALRDQHWDEIAEFILNGIVPPHDPSPTLTGAAALRSHLQPRWAVTLRRSAYLLLPVVAVLLVAMLGALLHLLTFMGPWAVGAGLVFLTWLTGRILTRL